MSCFGVFDTALQAVFRHRCGIGVLVLFQLDARHYLVGTQSGTGRRFRAVTFGHPFLLFLAFPFGRYNGHERRVDMRRRFVQMQVGRYDILLAERRGKVFHVISAPFVQTTFAHDALHIVGTSRQHDAYRPHLVLADLASKSCGLQAVLNRLRASMDAVWIFDQPTVQVRAFFVGVRRFDFAFDVGGGSAVGSAALLHMEYDIAHSLVVLGGYWFGGVQRGEAPLPYWGVFSVACNAARKIP